MIPINDSIIELLKIAKEEAKNSFCLKKKVGAALGIDFIKEAFTGHGGPKVPCEKCVRKEYEWQQDGCWSVHAEMSVILKILNSIGKDLFPRSTMVTTHGPCDQCLKYMYYLGIPRVFYEIPYHNDYTKWTGKIEVWRIDLENDTIIKEN